MSQFDGDTDLSRRRVLAATGAASVGLLAGCLGGEDGTTGGGNQQEQQSGDWRTTELSTVRDDGTFTIDGFDKPVVIQSFAVWCPKCQRQSEQIANLDDSVVRVGLNTDTNEDASKVRQHANSNGFDWRFAVAPTEMIESLKRAFGNTVVNAPSTPVIVTCQDGTTEFMSGSVNPVDEIESTAEMC